MSWLDRIQNSRLTIITGDGKEYTPLWMEAKKNINFNAAGFDFIGVDGTYVDRKKTSGTQYPILLYFQGENHIEVLNAFETSAKDSRPWTMRHPLYDDLNVQPLSLEIDNSSQNVSKVSGVVWETISKVFPEVTTSAEESIISQKEVNDEQLAANFTEEIKTPDSSSVPKSTKINGFVEKSYELIAKTNEEKQILKDAAREASGATQNMTAAPLRYIQKTQALINFPFSIQSTIETKVIAIKDNLDSLVGIFIRDDSTDEDYLIYESNANTMMSQAAAAAVNSDVNTYESRAEVIRVIDLLTVSYDSVLETYDDAGWNQNPDTAIQMDNIINETISALYEIAFSAKQERSTTLIYDSNIVILAHKYYGSGDDNLQDFIDKNNIQLNEYITVRRGRKIVWYV